MKKILSMALALIMVLSVIPVMALGSSAEEDLGLGKFSTGAETWRQKASDADVYYHHTQFLLTVPKSIWLGEDGALGGDDGIADKTGFQSTKYDSSTGQWTAGGIQKGKFVLTITDMEKKTETVVCPPTTYGSSGDTAILRFETADYGTPKYQIQYGNTYTVKMEVYYDANSQTPDWTSGEVDGISWAPGKADEGCDKMYSMNAPIDPTPTYIPEVDPYEKPVEVDWLTYNNMWFENHQTWGRVMMVGFEDSYVPEGGNTGANTIKTAAKIVITWDDGTVKTVDGFAPGNESFTLTSGQPQTYYRIPYDPFPAPGEHENVKIEFVRKADNKVMFTGTTTVVCGLYDDPDTDPDAPIDVTLSSPANAGSEKPTKSDWEIFGDKPVLVVDMDGIVSEQDVHSNTVEWEIELDGKAVDVKNPVESVKDLGAGGDGKFGAQLRLNVGTPTEGEHKVKVKVTYEGKTIYESNEITVYYTESNGKIGDLNGDGKVNASDRTNLARALSNWDGYEVPDVSVGDLNGDGKVNASDRTYLARALANWDGYSVE